MGRNNTKAVKNIAKMYEQLGLAQDDIFHKTKLLLSIYRDVVWATLSDSNCVNEEIYYYGHDLTDALVYLDEFAPDIERSEFERRVCNLFENKWMIDLIDKATSKVYDYYNNGRLYHEILSKSYLSAFRYTESELLEILNLERSTFYDRKKEAVIEKEVWIGNHVSLYSRAFVTPGSVLADGTIVGANAYISGTTSRGLYVGTPAKLKKEIESPNNIVKAQLLKDIIFSQYSNSATIYWNGVAMNDFSENAIYLWENIGQEPLLIENDHNITVGIFLEESCIVSEHYYSSYIVIKEEYIKGKTTEISECLRNTLRREGIILDYDTYTPYKLDYNMLKKRGIER